MAGARQDTLNELALRPNDYKQYSTLFKSGDTSKASNLSYTKGIYTHKAFSSFLKSLFIPKEYQKLRSLLSGDIKDVKEEDINAQLTTYRNSILAGKTESEVSEESRTLLTEGENIANKILSRLQQFEKKQSNPGVQAQTRIANKTSLLG